MRWLAPVVALSLLFAPAAPKRSRAPLPPNQLQEVVNDLKQRLANGEIARVEILCTPSSVTQTPLTPRVLEATPHYRLIIDDFRASPYRQEFQRAARSLAVQPLFANPNVRWGMIFYDLDRNRIVGLFYDPASRSGAVNETSASILGGLFDWAQSHFSRAFR
jgi:hypothetical protein